MLGTPPIKDMFIIGIYQIGDEHPYEYPCEYHKDVSGCFIFLQKKSNYDNWMIL